MRNRIAVDDEDRDIKCHAEKNLGDYCSDQCPEAGPSQKPACPKQGMAQNPVAWRKNEVVDLRY